MPLRPYRALWANVLCVGTIVSVELHKKKLSLIRQNCERLGLKSVRAHAADAADAAKLRAILAGATENADAQCADLVVLDAPCSGMGTLRRNPEHRYENGSRVAELTALQERAYLTGGRVSLMNACVGCMRELHQIATALHQSAQTALPAQRANACAAAGPAS